jgi:integrase/recombinase XerC
MRSQINENLNREDIYYIEIYLQNISRLNKSVHTIRNYRADIEKFCKWLYTTKHIGLKKVNGETISEYKEFLMKGGDIYQELFRSKSQIEFILWFSLIVSQTIFKKRHQKRLIFKQAPMSVSSRRRHLSSLKNFFEYLKETHEDYSKTKFQKNPVKSKIHSITLKDVDVVSTKMITPAEFEKIYHLCFRTKDRLMLDLLYHGGLRLSELCHLKKIDFDPENHSISFIRKGGSRHNLYIKNAQLIFSNFQFLISHEEIPSQYVFHNNKGEAYSIKSTYNQIMKILKKGNIRKEITPHSFRKACATNLYRESLDLLYVRDYLNHSDAKVTQTYIVTDNFLAI